MDFFDMVFILYWAVISVLDCTLFAYFSANGWDSERISLPMDHHYIDTSTRSLYAKTQHTGEY
jgi:hypothetical protein